MAGAGVPYSPGSKLVLPREIESVVIHMYLDMAEGGIKWHPVFSADEEVLRKELVLAPLRGT